MLFQNNHFQSTNTVIAMSGTLQSSYCLLDKLYPFVIFSFTLYWLRLRLLMLLLVML